MKILQRQIATAVFFLGITLFVPGCLTTAVQTGEKTETSTTKKIVLKKNSDPSRWRGTIDKENPLESAYDFYYENQPISSGIYEHQGVVFIIIEIPLSEDHEDKLYYQLQALLIEKNMLTGKYKLPSKFRLKKRVVENRKDDELIYFRYATVYDLAEIKALCNSAL